MIIDDRKRNILESIIKDYVETAEPVGSRAMVKKHNLKISAATARNEMADLEEMGYLEQPHTSAGRIPSESGFRYYVDCMMEKEKLADEEVELLEKIIKGNLQDWDQILQSVGNFLAQVTRYTSFVILPSIRISGFKHMQLIPVEKNRAVVLLIADSGLLMHRKIDLPDSIESKDLRIITDLFNRYLAGKKLDELRRSDLQLLRDELKKRRKVIDSALEAIENVVNNTGEERVVLSGVLNMFNEPEFKDLEKLRKVMAILEEEELLRSIIPEQTSDGIDITIGRENRLDDIKELSIVLARYKSFGDMGRIGVIGPVRMEYWKAAGTIESVLDVLEEILAKHF